MHLDTQTQPWKERGNDIQTDGERGVSAKQGCEPLLCVIDEVCICMKCVFWGLRKHVVTNCNQMVAKYLYYYFFCV